jgi:hypothetical protein
LARIWRGRSRVHFGKSEVSSTLNPNQYYRLPLKIMLKRREVGMSDRDVTHLDLVEIAKQNGDFRKNFLGSFRSIAGNYAGLRREGWIPVPLPPPAWPGPHILCANLFAIKLSNSSNFSTEVRTSSRRRRLVLLRMAHFSPELWTLQVRYGSRSSNGSGGL